MAEVRFGGWCCFCGKEMQNTQTDPCEVVVTTSAGGTQVWWCHAECLKERITDPENAPGSVESAFEPLRTFRSSVTPALRSAGDRP